MTSTAKASDILGKLINELYFIENETERKTFAKTAIKLIESTIETMALMRRI